MSEHERSSDQLIGQLVAGMATMTHEVALLRVKMENMEERVNKGKGMFYGALMVAGSAGAGLSQIIDRVLK